MEFARVGGLSPVKYKKNDSRYSNSFNGKFHSPPAKHGIYAFIWPHVELFLALWSKKNQIEFERNGIRRFHFEGNLYTHLTEEDANWELIDTSELAKRLRRDMHKAKIWHLEHNEWWNSPISEKIDHLKIPYLYSNKDHLEVFIPRSEMGKIK